MVCMGLGDSVLAVLVCISGIWGCCNTKPQSGGSNNRSLRLVSTGLDPDKSTLPGVAGLLFAESSEVERENQLSVSPLIRTLTLLGWGPTLVTSFSLRGLNSRYSHRIRASVYELRWWRKEGVGHEASVHTVCDLYELEQTS